MPQTVIGAVVTDESSPKCRFTALESWNAGVELEEEDEPLQMSDGPAKDCRDAFVHSIW